MKYKIVPLPRHVASGIANRTVFLFGTIILIAGSREANACSACSMSLVNLVFPFMWDAVWVLGIWRIVYLLFQIDSIRSSPIWFLGRELGILLFLYFTFWWACFFVYFLGYLLYAIYQSLRRLSLLKTGWATRIALLSHLLALLVLTPIAAKAYTAYAQQDDLEHLQNYVYPGTSQSRTLASRIAEDRSLDLSRIRGMLSSSDPLDSQRAFEVLYRRRAKRDLIELQDVVLGLLQAEDSDDLISSPRTSVWLVLWLDNVTGEEIRTKESLEGWISRATETPVE